MKNIPAVYIVSFLAFVLVSLAADAQDYVLTTRGDSLTGVVKPLLYGSQKKVQLISADKEKTTYSLFDIREYSQEGEIFRPMKGENGYVFMKLIQPGYLSLYAFQQENQVRFDGLFLKKLDGDQMVVPNLGFKKYISQFLDDCPRVVERIKGGELGKKNLEELVSAYNACVANRTVDHEKVIAERHEQQEKISGWDTLEEKIKSKEFTEKSNALDMVAEIKNKIQHHEKIPNFLIEGLKTSLQDTGLSEELSAAIGEINQ